MMGWLLKTDSDTDWSLAAFNLWENREYTVTAPDDADHVRLYLAAKEEDNQNNEVYIDYFYVDHAPAITVTSPTTGDAWYIGNNYSINWISYDITSNLDIAYSTDMVAWGTVTTNTPDAGTYLWTIPDDSGMAYVTVEETGGGVSGISNEFEIAERDTINVTSPIGGETWYRSVVYPVSWTYGPDVGGNPVDLSYSVNNGSSWTAITTGWPISSSPYFWTIPYEDSTQSLVKVEQPGTGIYGESPSVFTIATPHF